MNSEEEESDINTMEEVKEKELYFRHLNPEKLENKDFLKYVKSVGFVSEYLENKILFDEEKLRDRETRAKIVDSINQSFNTLDIGGNTRLLE